MARLATLVMSVLWVRKAPLVCKDPKGQKETRAHRD